jgi:hypothetical protein
VGHFACRKQPKEKFEIEDLIGVSGSEGFGEGIPVH